MESMPKCCVQKEFERKRASDIIAKLEEQQYSLDVCEWACKAFVSVAGYAMQTQNREMMADFLDEGGCETLLNILTKFSTVSTCIAGNGCLAISILAWSLVDLKEYLGEIGACEIVVFAISMNIGDPMVSEFGAAAVGLLAKNNISNSFKLAEAGACDAVAQLGNFGFNIRNDKCVEVATNVCLAFAQLCEAKNSSRLLESGASALIVELIKLHLKNTVFAAAATKAVCGLSSLNVLLREELGRVGACECILDIMRLHTAVQLSSECCEAVMHLSLSPSNTNKLGAAGACQAIVNALRHKLMEYNFGAEICSGAMLNLATYGSQASENRLKLKEAGAVDQLKLAQLSSKVSYRARENILILLEMLGADANSAACNGNQSLSNGSVAAGEGLAHSNGSPVPNGHGGSSSANGVNGAAAVNGTLSIQMTGNGHSGVSGKSSNGKRSSSKVTSVIHGSEMKGVTVPLQVEVSEVIEFDSKMSHSSSITDDDWSSSGSPRRFHLAKTNSHGIYEI